MSIVEIPNTATCVVYVGRIPWSAKQIYMRCLGILFGFTLAQQPLNFVVLVITKLNTTWRQSLLMQGAMMCYFLHFFCRVSIYSVWFIESQTATWWANVDLGASKFNCCLNSNLLKSHLSPRASKGTLKSRGEGGSLLLFKPSSDCHISPVKQQDLLAYLRRLTAACNWNMSNVLRNRRGKRRNAFWEHLLILLFFA